MEGGPPHGGSSPPRHRSPRVVRARGWGPDTSNLATIYGATIPSPPTAPGTVTEPTAVKEPSPFPGTAAPSPRPPVCTKRNAPSGVAAASPVPASVGVAPSSESDPPPPDAKPL